MNIDYTGHFAHVIGYAKSCRAISISIQNYYTFCNFSNRLDANAFNLLMEEADKDTQGVNIERPLAPFEVAVHHPK